MYTTNLLIFFPQLVELTYYDLHNIIFIENLNNIIFIIHYSQLTILTFCENYCVNRHYYSSLLYPHFL